MHATESAAEHAGRLGLAAQGTLIHPTRALKRASTRRGTAAGLCSGHIRTFLKPCPHPGVILRTQCGVQSPPRAYADSVTQEEGGHIAAAVRLGALALAVESRGTRASHPAAGSQGRCRCWQSRRRTRRLSRRSCSESLPAPQSRPCLQAQRDQVSNSC